jgi:hypothetical protein
VSLHHNHPDCTGEWGVRPWGGAQYWICNSCCAVGHRSVATNDGAILENLHGQVLARLTKEGRELLDNEW